MDQSTRRHVVQALQEEEFNDDHSTLEKISGNPSAAEKG